MESAIKAVLPSREQYHNAKSISNMMQEDV